ncbi:pilus assembly PilX N-terminal domain-containing protein [Tindallia californiensis]|nr:pilus assembly PilX N-terminal domain-containing protein [Tindallia californiensis]
MKKYNNDRGFTLIVVLLAFCVIMVLLLGLITTVSSQQTISSFTEKQEKSIQYAEAGFNKYLWYLNEYSDFYEMEEGQEMVGQPIAYDHGFYQLEVLPPDELDRYVTIRSTGWVEGEETNKRTIEVQVQRKQFVHHVYASESEGNNIWWTAGDEVHGPYHTNGHLRIRNPVFYDTVSYSGNYIRGNPYSPTYHNIHGGAEKSETMEIPATNSSLEQWAAMDGYVFEGRTAIHLKGDKIKVKYIENNTVIEEERPLPPNDIIYIKGNQNNNKWHPDTGNLFISGELEGRLTIGAENNIYITATDPTEWYDDQEWYPGGQYRNDESQVPPTPLENPSQGGITYKNTTFGDPDNPSVWDSEREIWIREAEGEDMLGLVANHDVLILHHGWLRDGTDGNGWSWDYEWEKRWTGPFWNRRFRNWQRSSTDSRMYDVAPNDMHIHGAVFATQGGFGFENHDSGSRKGDIILWGNITQKERLAVGIINSTGYLKKYAHDPRMFYRYPPRILEPTNLGWEIRDWKEVTGE